MGIATKLVKLRSGEVEGNTDWVGSEVAVEVKVRARLERGDIALGASVSGGRKSRLLNLGQVLKNKNTFERLPHAHYRSAFDTVLVL